MRYKDLFRKLDRNLEDIGRSSPSGRMLPAIIARLVEEFRDDLGLVGGRVYDRSGDHYVLREQYPERTAPSGFRIPVSYEPIRQLMRKKFVLYDPTDPGVDRELERALGVETFAGICVGEGCEQIIAFSLQPDAEREHVVYALNTVRHVINLKLRKERLEDQVDKAREIQLSLLPAAPPRFGPFDIHARTTPAEEVGGDLYDFLEVSSRSLGIAVVDSSGHGLPAALQARDAVIGLRMGVEERMRITVTVEKLNQVIERSALASQFISMFYVELERSGLLLYCNAGHNPPLLLRRGEFEELRRGGPVLGAISDARYERGYALLERGSVLLIYTDGITEAENGSGEPFGVDRLKRVVASAEGSSARELVERVFREVCGFSSRATPVDDQTLVAVAHPG
jgi:sigma-B regulation protein RsbU (phosphoserine phosphatase)